MRQRHREKDEQRQIEKREKRRRKEIETGPEIGEGETGEKERRDGDRETDEKSGGKRERNLRHSQRE